MAKRQASVDQFLEDSNHPRLDEIQTIRAVIMGSIGGITEHIKWNAPSYQYGGDDRVTFRLQPQPTLQLIFHRGAKVKKDSFGFDDSSGLLNWVTADRATVTFQDMEDVRSNEAALSRLVKEWMLATSEA